MTDELPLLDRGVIADLRESTGDDEAFVLELIGDYVAEAAGYVDAMNEAAAKADLGAVVGPAHTLKSTSASVGAMRLSAVCRSIEEAGREGRGDGLVDMVDDARKIWTATLDAFRTAGLAS